MIKTSPSHAQNSSTLNHSPNAAGLSSDVPVAEEDEPPSRGFSSTVKQNYLFQNGTTSSQSSLTICAPHDGTKLDAPHTLSPEDVVATLRSHPSQGLTREEAAARLAQHGPNVFGADDKTSWLTVLLRQIANAMTLVLIAVMALSFGVHDWVEGGVIVAIISINILVGFFQEFKAEKTMESLRSLASPTASVLRSGEVLSIQAADVVPGDILIINTGAAIPADGRLISCSNLEVNEMILTGESLPVVKQLEAIHDTTGKMNAGDRVNMVFASTACTKGRGRAIVTSTGSSTQMGQIAAALNSDTPRYDSFTGRLFDRSLHWLGIRGGTPLQRKMARLAYILLGAAVLLAIVVFASVKFEVDDQTVLYAIALGIGVIPESLSAVLTITFALGTRRMSEQNVIVRKLSSLESLGGVTDICSDKTGTLTVGKMVTKEIWVPSEGSFTVDTTGGPFEVKGKISKDNKEIDSFSPSFVNLARTACLCNVATIEQKGSEIVTTGDPTEIALQVFAMKAGFFRAALATALDANQAIRTSTPDTTETINQMPFSQLAEYPFDSTVKRMTTVYYDNSDGSVVTLQKGAVERVLDNCTAIQNATGSDDMTASQKEGILNQMESLASKGLRVLAFAHKRANQKIDMEYNPASRPIVEAELTFLGLAGIYDPPRLETAGAVADCKKASITVRMLTGDHPATAKAIALDVGILQHTSPSSAIMTAAHFDSLSDEQIDDLPELPLVIARCSPDTKARMLDAGMRRGYFIAMTGDGINDSPALSKAHVGIAMGSGSDVAKGVSDLVLMDDNFQSIVAAVKEGRRTFDNIQRFIISLLVGNVSEVLLLMLGLSFLDNNADSVFPLSPLSILWVNLVTASPPALGLGLEPAGEDIMERPPHDLKKGVFTWSVICDTLFYGATSGISCLVAFVILVYGVGNGELGNGCNDQSDSCPDAVLQARSVVFLMLTFHLLFICWEMKSLKRSVFNLSSRAWYLDLWRNQVLFWSVLFGFGLCFLCIYTPTFNTVVFRHEAITWQVGVALGFCALYIALIEIWKLVMHRRGGYAWFGRKLKKGHLSDAQLAATPQQEKQIISKV